MSRPDQPSPSHWREVQRLLHAALALPGEARAAWLAATGADAALRAEVAALLAADADPATLLDRAPAELVGAPTAPEAPVDPLAPGGRIGAYRIEGAVGRGGMGVVYRAHDERTDDAVALKVLRPAVAGALASAEARRRFVREIRVGQRVTHPGLVPVLDSGEVAGRLWFAMPFVDGETLRERLRRDQRLPLAVALGIARQLAEALAALAAHAVVHRDVKPDNVLLAHGHALLADFGVARALDLADADGSVTASGVVVGTVRYMSPEQIRGEPVGPAADVFALGGVLFEMLAGEPPFRMAEQRALLRPGGTAAPPDVRRVRPDVPDGVADAIRQALAAVAAERPTAAALARTLAGALAAAPTAPGA